MSEQQSIGSEDIADASSVLGDPDVVVSEVAESPPEPPDEYRVPPESLQRADALNAAILGATREGWELVNSIGQGDVDYLVLREPESGTERSFRVGPDGSLIEEEAPQLTPSAQPEQETTTAEGV